MLFHNLSISPQSILVLIRLVDCICPKKSRSPLGQDEKGINKSPDPYPSGLRQHLRFSIFIKNITTSRPYHAIFPAGSRHVAINHTRVLLAIRCQGRLQSSVDLQLDIHRRPGRAQVWLGFPQRLHQCCLQRPASRICIICWCIRELWLYELWPVLWLVPDDFCKSK